MAMIIRSLLGLERGLARWATMLRVACVRASREFLAAERAVSHAFALWWRRKSHRQLAKNLMIGFVILFVLQVLARTGRPAPLAGVRQATLDWQVAMLSGEDSGTDIALVDIDESSESSYQNQPGHAFFFTPRDTLKRLIEAVVAAKPRVVVVDFDLSQPATDHSPFAEAFREVRGRWPNREEEIRGTLTVPQNAHLDSVQRFFLANWRLSEYLRGYAQRCAPKPAPPAPGSCVPVILTRTVQQSAARGGNSLLRTPVPSFVDSAVEGSSTVLWGSATFDHDDDFVIRRWRLWEPVCTVAGRGDVLPSSALLAVALWKGWITAAAPSSSVPANETAWGSGEASVAALHRALVQRFTPTNCAGKQPESARSKLQETFVGPPRGGIPLTEDNLSRTIRYSISWSPKGSSLGTRLSAFPVSDQHPDITCHGDARPCATDKIVVIGSSYRDNGDYHRSLTGEMPGTFVLVNEINSLLQPQPVLKEDRRVRFVLELVLIVLMSWLLVSFNHTVVLLVGTATTLLIFVLSFRFLEAGVWLDVSLPLVGIQVHEWVARAERAWEHRKERTP